MSEEKQEPGQDFPPCYAIIVAGGTGNRMQNPVPKQFLTLQQKPVLMHTLQAFSLSAFSPKLILVLHEEYQEYWKKLCSEHQFILTHTVVNGGDTRYQSVKNGLDIVPQNTLVAIHDGARPLVSPQLIDNSFGTANSYGNAVAALQATDTVRQKKEKISQLDRDEIYLMQTPQSFKSSLLKEAYKTPYQNGMTDDASVWEIAGHNVHFIDGDRKNIKITWPDDLELAELYLKSTKPSA